jgi:amino acid transporter
MRTAPRREPERSSAAVVPVQRTPSEGVTDKGLRGGVLSTVSSVVIGVAATAPAYSMAATLGYLVIAGVGVKAPAFILLAFVPMLFSAVAFRELNRAEPDCGTTFTWASRAFGPSFGWFSGWVVMIAQILVMTSQSALTGRYTFLLLGAKSLAGNSFAVLLLGAAWLFALCFLCYRGIEISAKVQWALLVIEVTVLVIFSIVALTKVFAHTAGPQSLTPSLSWLWPSGVGIGAFVSATLLAVFIYWGFESALSVNEESAQPHKSPGKAVVLSTSLLVINYLLVTVAAIAFAGVGQHGIGLANPAHSDDVLEGLGGAVFGSGFLGWVFRILLVISVLTSAAATSQATIMPAARTTLAMASHGALPKIFARMHPRFQTPSFSTWAFGGVSLAVYIGLSLWSSNVLGDSVEAVGVTIATEYCVVGFACVWVFRRTLLSSVRHFVLRGVLPGISGLFFLVALGMALYEYSDPSYGETQIFGIGGVAVIGVGCMLLGVLILLVLRRTHRDFFRGKSFARGHVAPGDDTMVVPAQRT